MAKGTYAVGEGGDAPARDASYKSCLCALLVFIAICAIILLASIRWAKDEIKKDVKDEIELLGLNDSEKTTKPYEKFVSENPTTRSTTPGVQEVTPRKEPPTTTTSTTPTTTSTTTSSTPATTTTQTTTTSTTKMLKYVMTQNSRENEVQKELTTSSTSSTTIRPIQNATGPYEDLGKDIEIGATTTEAINDVTTEIVAGVTTFEAIHDVTTESVAGFKIIEVHNETSTTETVIDNEVSEIDNETSTTETIVDVKIIDVDNETFTTEATVDAKILYNETSRNTTEDIAVNVTEAITETTKAFTPKEYIFISKLANFSSFTSMTEELTTETESSNTKEVFDATDTTIDESIGVTETYIPEVIQVILNTTEKSTTAATLSVITLKPDTTTVSETTTETFGQQVMIENYDDYLNSNETIEIISKVNKQTTESIEITNKTQSWHETMSTTTKIPPLLTKSEPVCLSVECKSAASRMLSLMNHSVDPCEDFYEFACGGIETDNADSDTWKRLSEQLYLINNTAPPYLQKFKEFYDSCVSFEYQFDYQDRISKVLELVKEVGEILDGEPPAGTFDMTELFGKLILRQSLPIMDIDVDIDKQSSKFILKLTLPRKTSVLKESGRWSALSEGQKRCLDEQRQELQQPNLNLNKIHDSYLTCQQNHAIYLNSIQTVVRALGFYSHLNDTFNQTQRIQDLRTTIEWDILEYLNALPPPNEIRKTTLFKNYKIEKVSDLQTHYPFLEWNKLFKILTGHDELENSTTVQVYFIDYFTALFQGLQKIAKWKINNALIAMYANDLYENLVIPQARHKREIYCLKLSNKLFHDISSNLYMKTWPKKEMEDSQKFLTKIFTLLKRNLKKTLLSVDWLDDDSRVLIMSKADKMNLTFNKKEDLYNNEEYLNLKYSNIALKPNDFQYNAVRMLETGRNMLYALQGKAYSTNYLWSYFLNAYDSVPTSFYSKVLIMAPLGMVKQPVSGFPEYITMARIGLSLAREIGRHFDPVGIKYNMTLSPESKLSYDGLVDNMENEELFNGKRTVGQQDVTFEADTKLSVNERIADNTGLRLISDVFNRTDFLLPWISGAFSREKVFYITVAQEYCKKTDMSEYMQQLFETEMLPASLRVQNIMTNSDDFSDVFECKEGSAMNHNPMKTQFPYLQKVEDYSEEFQNIS